MRKIELLSICFAIFFLLFQTSCSAEHSLLNNRSGISPYTYGLAEAKSDTERYNVLYKTHQAAINSGKKVDYSGISTISIEIPTKAKPIPLPLYTDFHNCIITVKNNKKDVVLFETIQSGKTINLTGKEIDNGVIPLNKYNLSKKDVYLLVIKDDNIWVEKRIGYKYGHYRKDILLVVNGKAVNSVVSPYANVSSSPSCQIIKAAKDPLVIKNLTIKRDPKSEHITNVLNISGYNEIQISNITINTPVSTLNADRAIKISNSTNVFLDNVKINGTYSQLDKSGYGISLDNIWNFTGEKLYGNGNWGVFGNNNINHATIIDSKINRFDVHCYGRDMSFRNVHFFNLYNQFSSVFGNIVFENCLFDNSVPLINGTSYNSYVAYNVYFKNCSMNATDGKNYILKLGINDDNINQRQELREKCWPNIYIENFVVNCSDDVQHFYIITNKEGLNKQSVGYISAIKVTGLKLYSDNNRFKGVWMSRFPLLTKNIVRCRVSDVILGKTKKKQKNSTRPTVIKMIINGNNYILK